MESNESRSWNSYIYTHACMHACVHGLAKSNGIWTCNHRQKRNAKSWLNDSSDCRTTRRKNTKIHGSALSSKQKISAPRQITVQLADSTRLDSCESVLASFLLTPRFCLRLRKGCCFIENIMMISIIGIERASQTGKKKKERRDRDWETRELLGR